MALEAHIMNAACATLLGLGHSHYRAKWPRVMSLPLYFRLRGRGFTYKRLQAAVSIFIFGNNERGSGSPIEA